MTHEPGPEAAELIARSGNVAVVQLAGRRFPGLLIQGDTFSTLLASVREARVPGADVDAELSDLDERMTELIEFYENTLAQHGIERPYVR